MEHQRAHQCTYSHGHARFCSQGTAQGHLGGVATIAGLREIPDNTLQSLRNLGM